MIKGKKSISVQEKILMSISQAVEFEKYRSKPDERKELNDLNKGTLYPLKGSICTPDRKAFLLL